MSENPQKVAYTRHPEHIEAVVTGELEEGEIKRQLDELFSLCQASGIIRTIIDTTNLGGERTATGGVLFGMMFEDLYNKLTIESGRTFKVAFLRNSEKLLAQNPEFNIYKKPTLDVNVFFNRDEALDWILS